MGNKELNEADKKKINAFYEEALEYIGGAIDGEEILSVHWLDDDDKFKIRIPLGSWLVGAQLPHFNKSNSVLDFINHYGSNLTKPKPKNEEKKEKKLPIKPAEKPIPHGSVFEFVEKHGLDYFSGAAVMQIVHSGMLTKELKIEYLEAAINHLQFKLNQLKK